MRLIRKNQTPAKGALTYTPKGNNSYLDKPQRWTYQEEEYDNNPYISLVNGRAGKNLHFNFHRLGQDISNGYYNALGKIFGEDYALNARTESQALDAGASSWVDNKGEEHTIPTARSINLPIAGMGNLGTVSKGMLTLNKFKNTRKFSGIGARRRTLAKYGEDNVIPLKETSPGNYSADWKHMVDNIKTNRANARNLISDVEVVNVDPNYDMAEVAVAEPDYDAVVYPLRSSFKARTFKNRANSKLIRRTSNGYEVVLTEPYNVGSNNEVEVLGYDPALEVGNQELLNLNFYDAPEVNNWWDIF